MNKSESWKTWLPWLGLLVLFGLVTAVWPSLANSFSLPSLGGGGSGTSVPVEIEPIHFDALKTTLAASPLSAPIASALPDSISPFVALAAVTGLIIALIVGMGGGIYFLMKTVSGMRDGVIETDSFQEHKTALDTQVKAQIKEMRDGRTTHAKPEHKMPRWSVISNTLIALMFVGFGSMVLVRNFFPEGTTLLEAGTENARIASVTPPVFAVLALITLIILGIRLRPQKIDAIDETDSGKIPWDFIAVLITGLVMIGLGIGFMAYINAPV